MFTSSVNDIREWVDVDADNSAIVADVLLLEAASASIRRAESSIAANLHEASNDDTTSVQVSDPEQDPAVPPAAEAEDNGGGTR